MATKERNEVIAGTIPPPPAPTEPVVPEPEKLTKEDKAALKAAEDALTPEEREANAKLAAKASHTPDAANAPAPVNQGTTYVGPVTCTSTSFETGELVSARIRLPEPVHEDRVFYAFQQHHPSARREGFKIDPTNTDDPGLRTSKE